MPPTAVEQFQDALGELAARSGEASSRLLNRISVLSPVEARAFITDAYPDLLTPFLAASSDLTAQWYAEQPTAARRPGVAEFVPVRPPLAGGEQLAISGRWALTQNDPVTALQGSATRNVMNASRDTVILNAQRENVRWVRQAKMNACGFCKMLATRAAKDLAQYSYSSQGVARKRDRYGNPTGDYTLVVIGKRGRKRRKGGRNFGSEYHDHCRCTAVPIRDGSYEPPDYVQEWTEQYDAIVKREGTGDLLKISNLMDVGRVRPDRIAKTAATVAEPAAAAIVNLDEPNLARKTDPAFDPLPDIAAVNPRWQEGYEWDNNCTRCSLTVELRHRGYDVTAEPKPRSVKDNNDKGILERFRSKTGVVAGEVTRIPVRRDPNQPVGMGQTPIGSRYFHVLPKGRKQARKAAEDAVLAWGEGSRGYVVVTWTGRRSSHIFNVENRGGKVVFTDGQSAEIDASGHWDRISISENSAQIVRVDDLDLVPDKVEKWTRSRTAADIAGDAQRIADIQNKNLNKSAQRDADAVAKFRRSKLMRKVKQGPSLADYDQGWQKYVSELSDLNMTVPADARNDFIAGALRARQGNGAIDPDAYSSDPDRADAYRSGWFWYRRWKDAILTS